MSKKDEPFVEQNGEEQGRKQGDTDRSDTELHGEHTAKAPELGTNSLADKKPKGKPAPSKSGGGM